MTADDDQLLTLPEAVRECLGDRVHVRTLQAAHRRGELVVERLGNRVYVTPSEIMAWRRRCRSDQKGHGSGSEGTRESRLGGTSGTDSTRNAQAAARTIFEAPKQP